MTNINIFASVSTSVELEEGETVEQLKERFVDIYLHGLGRMVATIRLTWVRVITLLRWLKTVSKW